MDGVLDWVSGQIEPALSEEARELFQIGKTVADVSASFEPEDIIDKVLLSHGFTVAKVGRVLLPRGEPGLWRHVGHFPLKGVELSDLAHRGFGGWCCAQLHKTSARAARAMDDQPRSL